MKSRPKITKFLTLTAALASALKLASPDVFAASQTWANAPVDQTWTNVLNWVGGAAPGGIDMTGNTVNNDTATFNTPIPGSGIGGAGAPVLVDDATVVNARSRQVGSITFDTANCGAYVFSSLSAEALPTETTPETGILNVSHNGSITINADVTHSQVFQVPVYTRLPSSTAGIYNIVNNATDSSVTLTLDRLVNNSAATRGTDFRLGGSNIGANTIAYISAGTTEGGANGLTKQGSGTWILTGDNDFRSQTVVSIVEGTLIAQNIGVFGQASTATVSGSGVLQLDADTLYQPTLNLNDQGTIRANGQTTVNGLIVGSSVGTEPTLATTSASDVLYVGTGLLEDSILSGGAASTVLHTAGPGTVFLTTDNTYAGNWSIDSGTVQVYSSGALGTGPNANVGAGAVFDFTELGAVTYVPTVAAFGGSGTGSAVGSTAAAVMGAVGGTFDLSGKAINLTFTPTSTSGDTTHPALTMAQGTLQLSGNTFYVNNAAGSPLDVGTYRLIEQTTGSITSGGGYGVLIDGSGVAANTAASIVVSDGTVDLVVVSYTPKNLVWSGTGSIWDNGFTSDWLNGGASSVFNNSDDVTFNSVGAANPNVSLSGTLAPSSVTVDTSANAYSFGGSGKIAGTGSLVKNSTGVLTVGTANTYAGGTVVNGGTLRVGIAEAVSSTGAGDLTVNASATLDMNGFANTVNALQGAGTVDEQSGGSSVLTMGNNDQSGSFSGIIQNTSGTLSLAKVGTGTQTLSGANTFSGTTLVTAGTLEVANSSALGAGNLVIDSGTVNVQADVALNSLTGAGGVIVAGAAGTNTLTLTLTNLNEETTYAAINDDTNVNGVLAFVQNGPGTLRMESRGYFTGGSTLNGGTNFMRVYGTLGTGPITLNSGVLKLRNGVTLDNPVYITGEQTIDFWGNIYLQCALIGDSNSIVNFSNVELVGNTITPQSRFDLTGFYGTIAMKNTALEYLRMDNNTLGGTTTTYDLGTNNAFMVQRSAGRTTVIGHLIGGDQTQIQGNGATTYILGGKNLSGSYLGTIQNGTITLIKEGTGTLSLAGTNLWTGGTIVSNGVLALVGPEGNPTNTTSVSVMAPGTLDVTQLTDGTLYLGNTNGVSIGGNGTINGSIALAASVPATVTPGASIGTLTIGNALTLTPESAITMEVATGNNSDQIAASNITLGGASITVTNVGGSSLQAGDTFQLFSLGVADAGAVNLPLEDTYGTYTWDASNLSVNGSVTVATATPKIDPTPTDLQAVASNGTLQLSWPASHTGWIIQSNAVSLLDSNAWYAIPGSESVNMIDIPIDSAEGEVYFRMTLP